MKRMIIVVMILTVLFAVWSAGAFAEDADTEVNPDGLAAEKNKLYLEATTLFLEAKYEEAKAIYEKLGDYEHSKEFIAYCEKACDTAEEFHKDALEGSSRFQKDGDFWSIAADYVGVENGYTITVSSILNSTYVAYGWGPELRIACRANQDYYEVTAFRATINGRVFQFENLDYNADKDIHAGYMFGGTVYEELMNELMNVKTASFQVAFKDGAGQEQTAGISHAHTGELSPLISVANYYDKANAFSTDINPAQRDACYGASIE